MRPNRYTCGFLALLFSMGLSTMAAAWSIGPPDSHTGAPAFGSFPRAEQTCYRSGCHSPGTGGGFNDGNGTIELVDLPDVYVPGETYEITVRLSSTSNSLFPNRRWGFQLTAMEAESGLGDRAGSFIAGQGFRLRSVSSTGREYVMHDQTGYQQGTTSPAEWTFQWIAPSNPAGTVLFYFAGNAANGNGAGSGDFIYTGNDSIPLDPTPVEGASWGGIKTRNWK